MAYPKEFYQKAQEILDQRRAKAQDTAAQHRAELYSAMPELEKLERDLSATGLAAAQAALAGGPHLDKIIENLKNKNLALQRRREELLQQAGFPKDFLQERYTCPICQDTGVVGQRPCQCFTELLRKLAYEKLSDTSGIDRCRFESFQLRYYPDTPTGRFNIIPRQAMAKVLSFCQDYAAHFSFASESLLLCGGTGLGKTHLSLSIAYEVTKQGFGVVYTPSHRLLDKLQTQQFSRRETGDDDYQSVAMDCDLLIIDDLGAEFSTNFTVAALYSLINGRLNEGRPTIISTNYDETILRERYGDRILSRLLCAYKPLQFYGEDIRMLKRLNG